MGIRVNQGWEFTHLFVRPNRSFFEKKIALQLLLKEQIALLEKSNKSESLFVKSDKGDSLSSPFLKEREE